MRWERLTFDPHAVTISHGLCAECVDAQRAKLHEEAGPARVLRGMIAGNVTMAKRLLSIGDASMALRETEQALTKIDQLLKTLP
jgi:hypothetical protein